MAVNVDRLSRPNSLALDVPPGEKEPLHFDVQLVGAPPEVEQLVNNIKQVAEDFLYHWKTFSIVLPPSRFTGPGNRLSDIIIAPSCEEFDLAALEGAGEPQPLSPKQLHQIRERGEFEVPSRHFPGQVQVWRVSSLLQMGRVRSREALCRHVAFAAALIVVVARDRLLRDCHFSAIAGIKSLLNGLHRLLDLAIGMPAMEARDLEKKIRDERSRYLVAELICKSEHEQELSALWSWARGALRGAHAPSATPPPPPPVLCVYTTPQHTKIDLRLYRREILRKAAPTLQVILERESRGWFLHFRERRAAMLASQKVPMKDIEEEIREAAIREYVSRICAAVMSSETLASIGKDVPTLLADQLRAYIVMDRAQEAVRRKLEAGVAAAEARLKAAHPILARSNAWRKEKLNEAIQRISSELRWAALEEAAVHMAAHRLHQHRYFLLRDLAFLREREPLLMKELRAAKTPRKEFEWRTRIWFPQNYIIWRHFRGKKERIPTVVSSRATNIVTPRSDPSQPVFVLQRENICSSTTSTPGYHLQNIAHRTWSWCWNLMYVLIIFVPWCSPLSVRSLVCVKPFVPDYELSQVNGTLFPKRSSETPTMWSRLLRLWKYVSKHRTRFETTPDTGLFGRGLSRQANRIFNIGVIGCLGSLALLLLFPIAVIVTSALSFVVGCTAPLWMPMICLCVHVVNATVYDFDARAGENRWFVLLQVLVWRIGILGILQPIAAVLVALVICPLASLIITVGGGAWWAARGGLQAALWRGAVRGRARVPLADSLYCRRVAPRTAAPPIHTLTSAQALAAICARGELEALNAWASDTEKIIERPLRDYRQFVQACFGPFSVQIAKTGAYKQLEKECAELTASLREKVVARKSDLSLTLTDSVRSRIRMRAQDLRRTIQAGAGQLSRIWGAAAQSEEWWAARGLEPGDWHALAANTLVDVFDTDVMSCISESEPSLEIAGAGAGVGAGGAGAGWAALCPHDAPPPDVLESDDCAMRFGLWSASESCPRVVAPALDAAAFGVRSPPHPPLPPPHLIALLLHNRDSDSPIPLESEFCGDILKALEDAPDAEQTKDEDNVERYRGGGSEDISSDGSEEEGKRSEPSESGSEPADNAAEPTTAPLCRVSPSGSRAACRWTLTGRGVRLRADLASPEDVNLDIDRSHVGTSV